MTNLFPNTMSLSEEMASYESLWGMPNATIKTIAEAFKKHSVRPSELLSILSQQHLFLAGLVAEVRAFLEKLRGFSVSVHGGFQYPTALRAARHPIELFYYRGELALTESPCISIVGARKASPDGLNRANRLSRELAEQGFTIVSGLATGIDTAAMNSAIACKGRTIGVIGTPINDVYPKDNTDLQEKVASEHLLISQVPFYRYAHQPFKTRAHYFPQRNETMAALSQATVIVEASDTSGSLTQARACMQQGRKLFILNSCFENKDISWPSTYEKRGAIRVRETQDILQALKS